MLKNQVIIVGNLASKDGVELNYSGAGKAWCRFTVVEGGGKKKDSDERWPSHFFDCKMFGEHAEHFAESAAKGDRVMVTGTLEQEKWETDDGDKRSRIVVIVDEAGLSTRWHPVEAQRPERS